jgi:hypothetical protein
MPDESEESPTAPPADESAPPAPPARKHGFIRRHWAAVALATVILVPALIFTIWAGIALAFSYAKGEQVGFVRKLSSRGWICKTFEGELEMAHAPGSPAQIFAFTVRDDSVAAAISRASGKRVALTFEQHVGVPSRCFGDTPYFVTSVRVVDDR